MKSKARMNIFLLACFIVAISLVVLYPSESEGRYRETYFWCSVGTMISVFLLGKYMINPGARFYDPIVIVTILYAAMYFVTPIYDVLLEEYEWFSYDLFEYGGKSSAIALAGYLTMYFAYRTRVVSKKTQYIISDYVMNSDNYTENNRGLIIFIVSMYAVCFLANAWYMVNYYGASLVYLLTLGMVGEASRAVNEGAIGFVSMLSYCLPTVTLMYCEYGRSRGLKIIFFVLMFILQVSRGFRFLIIQIIITFVAYYCIRSEKRIKVKQLLLYGMVLLFFLVLMTLFRDSIRGGHGIDIASFNIKMITDALDAAIWENLRIYKNYYGMVGVIPAQFDYVYGRQLIIGTIVMLVPRALWPGKISSYGGYGLTTLIGPRIASGQAYPNLGEYYYAWGIFGVVLCMFMYGKWLKWTKERFMAKASGCLNNMLFAVMLGCNIQLIIRGYFPSSFWYLVFSLLPVVFAKLFFPHLDR